MEYGPADPYPTYTLGGKLAPPVDGQKGVIFNRAARVRSQYRAVHGEDPPPGWKPPPPEDRPPTKQQRKQMEEIDRKFWKYKKLRDEFGPRPEEYPGEYGNPALDPFPQVHQPVCSESEAAGVARHLRPPTRKELAEMERINAKYWHYKRLRDRWHPLPEEEHPERFGGPPMFDEEGQGFPDGYVGDPDVHYVGGPFGASQSSRTRRSSTGSAPFAPHMRPPFGADAGSSYQPSMTSTIRPPSSGTMQPPPRPPSQTWTQPFPPRPASAAGGSGRFGPAPAFGSGARPPLGRRGSLGGLPSSYSPRSELLSDSGRLGGPSDCGGIYGEWPGSVKESYCPESCSSRTPSTAGTSWSGDFWSPPFERRPGPAWRPSPSMGSSTCSYGCSSSTSRRY